MTTRSLGAAVVGTVVLGSRPARAHVDYVTDGPGAALGALEFAATVLSNPVNAGLLAVSGLPPPENVLRPPDRTLPAVRPDDLFTTTLLGLPDDPVLAHVTLFGMASAVFVMGAGPLALDNRFGRPTSDDATSVVPGD